MESVFRNFNLLIFMTQLIIHIKFLLICVEKYIMCGGEIKIWKYRSGRDA